MRAMEAYSADVLIAHVRYALEQANAMNSKLPAEVLAMQGMTGVKTRYFYNNLGSLRAARYLEVGTWAGSSLVATLYGNPTLVASVCDNWSEFGGPRDAFHTNVARFLPGRTNLTVVDGDCFAPDPPFRGVDIYLYDGAHGLEDHRNAITHMWPCLSDRAIVLVDDYCVPEVKQGTQLGLADVQAKVLYSTEIVHYFDPAIRHTPMHIAKQEFWNGIGVFVVEKE